MLGGYCHLDKEVCARFPPKDLIGDMPYEFTETTSYFSFRTKKRSPLWNFGDPAPDKQKKHIAGYVWQSLV